MGNKNKKTDKKQPVTGVILSGMRPTGPLHLGHLLGPLVNWAAAQDDYTCFFEIADLHTLTDRTDTSNVAEYRYDVLLDWLAAGLDPERSALFLQSEVPQHALLYTLFGMFIPVGWLERVPTYKEQISELGLEERASFGLLGYPVLQAADIVLYKADTVPIGEDQLPHLEFTRELVRRFNHLFGDVFIEPQALISKVRRLKGVDNRKMSKSYDNAIYIKDDEKETKRKIRSMITDPKRVYRNDPGHPEKCNVFDYRTILEDTDLEQIKKDCKNAEIGCTDCKEQLSGLMNGFLKPIRERRAGYAENPERLNEILDDGRLRATEVAAATYEEAFAAVKLPRGDFPR
ncbi:MAG: tryptophan--tRNA ligase [bacterium]|nr:tryptophan--tRNA ligase [bacterium]